MGAHVWSGTYLRDHLLPHGRLSGWTPDWYAGAPAFHFYMVVPFLLILLLDVVLPYAIAFKLVASAGWCSCPPPPGPSASSRAALPRPADAGRGHRLLPLRQQLHDLRRQHRVDDGGRVRLRHQPVAWPWSTSAWSPGACETGRHRALAAVLLALVGLCHLIPAFFAIVGTLVMLALRARRPSLRWLLTVAPVAGLLGRLLGPAVRLAPGLHERHGLGEDPALVARTRSGPPTGGPGWATRSGRGTTACAWLLALVGVAGGIAGRKRPHLFLTIMTVLAGVAFVLLPQGRLWNARLLPFYYLGTYLLAALGVVEIARALAARFVGRPPHDPPRPSCGWCPWRAVLLTLIWVGMALRTLPFGSHRQRQPVPLAGPDGARGQLRGRVGRAGTSPATRAARRPSDGGGYHEYRDLIETMKEVGAEQGCGRAMWEYEPELVRYGTPMALMLLPHWTDGCIGSMEGLYFESSATTPFHFLNQSELSAVPSRAQRDLPYGPLDVARGVEHLQLMGVKYYLTTSETARAQAGRGRGPHRGGVLGALDGLRGGGLGAGRAAGQPACRPDRRRPGPGRVAGAGRRLVPGRRRPRCAPGRGRPAGVAPGRRWGRSRPPCRSSRSRSPTSRRATTASASTWTRSANPSLVRTSYFPNWDASGAEGPYRVAPNLMVVVPDRHPRRAALRLDARRPARLAPHPPRHRRRGPPGPPTDLVVPAPPEPTTPSVYGDDPPDVLDEDVTPTSGADPPDEVEVPDEPDGPGARGGPGSATEVPVGAAD